MYNAWHHFSVNCCFMHFFLKLKEKYACNYIETIHFLFRWSMLQIGFHGIYKKKKKNGGQNGCLPSLKLGILTI